MCVRGVLAPVGVHGYCFDFHLGQGRCRGGQDLRGGAQLTKATTRPVSQLRGTANPARVPCPHSGEEGHTRAESSETKPWEGSYLLLVPLCGQQKKEKSVACWEPRQRPRTVSEPLDKTSQSVSGRTALPGPLQVPTPCSATSLSTRDRHQKSPFLFFLRAWKWWPSLTLRNTRRRESERCHF